MADQRYAPVIAFLTAVLFAYLALMGFSASPGDGTHAARSVWGLLALAFAYSGVRLLRTKAIREAVTAPPPTPRD